MRTSGKIKNSVQKDAKIPLGMVKAKVLAATDCGKMKNKILFLVFSLFSLILIQPVFAHCPLCSAATGVAVGMARWYGIDDLIVGTFAGGFIIATGFWMNNFLLKRHKGKEYIPFQLEIIILFSFLSTVLTFMLSGITNAAFTLFGIDKIIIGFTFGSAISLASFKIHDVLRKINRQRNFFPFQVIILTLLFLSVTSASFYLMGWL